MRTRSPEAPNARSIMIDQTAVSASSRVLAMMTPLPAASPSALMTTGKPNSPERRAASASSDGLGDPELAGRNPVAGHEPFGVDLAGFEFGGRAGRAKDAEAARFESVDDAQRQRHLGPDDRQVDPLAGREIRSAPPHPRPRSRHSRPRAASRRFRARKRASSSAGSGQVSKPGRARGHPTRRPGFSSVQPHGYLSRQFR